MTGEEAVDAKEFSESVSSASSCKGCNAQLATMQLLSWLGCQVHGEYTVIRVGCTLAQRVARLCGGILEP